LGIFALLILAWAAMVIFFVVAAKKNKNIEEI